MTKNIIRVTDAYVEEVATTDSSTEPWCKWGILLMAGASHKLLLPPASSISGPRSPQKLHHQGVLHGAIVPDLGCPLFSGDAWSAFFVRHAKSGQYPGTQEYSGLAISKSHWSRWSICWCWFLGIWGSPGTPSLQTLQTAHYETPTEWKMSHWTESPFVLESENKSPLLWRPVVTEILIPCSCFALNSGLGFCLIRVKGLRYVVWFRPERYPWSRVCTMDRANSHWTSSRDLVILGEQTVSQWAFGPLWHLSDLMVLCIQPDGSSSFHSFKWSL